MAPGRCPVVRWQHCTPVLVYVSTLWLHLFGGEMSGEESRRGVVETVTKCRLFGRYAGTRPKTTAVKGASRDHQSNGAHQFDDPQDLDFPLNAWYAAAWDHEVGRNLLAETVADRPMVFYRTTDGRAVALADACWHRLAPLSMGKLRGDDEIMCGYHGICLRRRRARHLHAGPGDDQPQRDGALLPGRRAPPLRLGVAGRPGAGRPRRRAGPVLERPTRTGRATARPSTSTAATS